MDNNTALDLDKVSVASFTELQAFCKQLVNCIDNNIPVTWVGNTGSGNVVVHIGDSLTILDTTSRTGTTGLCVIFRHALGDNAAGYRLLSQLLVYSDKSPDSFLPDNEARRDLLNLIITDSPVRGLLPSQYYIGMY